MLEPIVLHILYGDIYEMPMDVLDDKIDDEQKGKTKDGLDDEQEWKTTFGFDDERDCRLACAATVQAWIEGRLHRGGYKWDGLRHKPEDLIRYKQ